MTPSLHRIALAFALGCQAPQHAVSPPPAPIPPGPLDVQAQTLPGGQVHVFWSDFPGSAGYVVFRALDDCQTDEQRLTDGIAEPEFLDSPPDGRWCYIVRAQVPGGMTDPSAIIGISDSQAPSMIPYLLSEPVPDGVVLVWEPGPGEPTALFNVYRDGELIGETGLTVFQDVDVPPGGYVYAVSALDQYGNESEPYYLDVFVEYTATVAEYPSEPEPDQWLVVSADPDCPVPDDQDQWSYEHLFPDVSSTSVLATYCVYDSDLPGPPGFGGGGFSPIPVGARVTPQAQPWIEDVQRQQADAFAARAGALDQPVSTTATATLAVLDTSPESLTGEWLSRTPSEERSPHGYAQLRLAQSLVCPGGTCAADVHAILALPLVNQGGGTTIDTVLGGTHGTLLQLATAITRAVDTASGPAVLDLPLAWPPSYGSGASWPADVQAVYDALAYARCSGAIIFAAVGNDSGGQTDFTSAMLPAAWADEELDLSTCEGSYGVTPPAPEDTCSDCEVPLLYAVGGLNADTETEIAIARPLSTPVFMAAADHASVAPVDVPGWVLARQARPPMGWVPNPLQRPGLLSPAWSITPLTPVTGTSVATTVVSSAAALVLSVAPSLTPVEVAEILRLTGAITTLGIEIAPELVPDSTARRVSVCRAVSAVVGGLVCQDGPQPLPTVDVSSLRVSTISPSVGGPFSTCGHPSYGPTTPPMEPCPLRQYYTESINTSTIPQNPINSCESCGFFDDGRMVVGEAVDAVGETALAAVLYLEKVDGSAVSYELPVSLVRGAAKLVQCPSCDFANVKGARVDIKVQTLQGEKSRYMPLYRAGP